MQQKRPQRRTANDAVISCVKAEMTRRGIKNTQLAQLLGCSDGRVTQILSAKNLTLKTAQRLADVLGMQLHVELIAVEDVDGR